MAKTDSSPVGGVVLSDDQGRYLLVQEKQSHVYGLWNLPAGHVDENETLRQAAVREAREEVGFEIELVSDEPLLHGTGANDTPLTSFKARIIGGELAIPKEELLDAQWFSVEEIKALDASGKIRNPWVIGSILKDAAL